MAVIALAGYVPMLVSGLIDDIEEMTLPQGIENSLISKLENALKSLEKGNDGAAINQLNAFINEVEAQSGKNITEDDADSIIFEVLVLISKIKGEPPPSGDGA
ncbi:hypothetical protein ACFLVW_05195 [Chloroflexota bacterium]